MNSFDTREQVLAALAELVACKDLKDRAVKINSQARYNLGKYRRMLLNEHQQRKEPAWTAARAALEAVRRELEAT